MISLTERYETFQESLYPPSFIGDKFFRKVKRAIEDISCTAVKEMHYEHIEAYVVDCLMSEQGLRATRDPSARVSMLEEYRISTGRELNFDIRECLSSMRITYVSFVGGRDVILNSPQGIVI